MIVALRFLRDRRRWLASWCVAMVALVFVNVAFYPSFKEQPTFDDLFAELPDGVQSLFGIGELPLTAPAGYLHSQVFTTMVPVALLIFSIALGARAVGGSEDDGTLELLLANPISRMRVASERFAAMVGLVFALGAVSAALVFALSAPFELLEGISAFHLLAACAAATALGLVHAAIAFATGAALGGRSRAISVAAAVAVGGYVLFGFTDSAAARPTRFANPWYWYLNRNIVAFGPGAEAVLVPLGVAVALGALGIWRLGARDLR